MHMKYKKIYTKSPALDSGNLTLEERDLPRSLERMPILFPTSQFETHFWDRYIKADCMVASNSEDLAFPQDIICSRFNLWNSLKHAAKKKGLFSLVRKLINLKIEINFMEMEKQFVTKFIMKKKKSLYIHVCVHVCIHVYIHLYFI